MESCWAADPNSDGEPIGAKDLPNACREESLDHQVMCLRTRTWFHFPCAPNSSGGLGRVCCFVRSMKGNVTANHNGSRLSADSDTANEAPVATSDYQKLKGWRQRVWDYKMLHTPLHRHKAIGVSETKECGVRGHERNCIKSDHHAILACPE